MRDRNHRTHALGPLPGDEGTNGRDGHRRGRADREAGMGAGHEPANARQDRPEGRGRTERGGRSERGERPDHAERIARGERGGLASGRGHAGFGPRGRGRGPQDVPDAGDAAAWLIGRLPDGWFAGAPEVTIDRDEILIVGTLPDVEGEFSDAAARAAAEAGRISRFREETREQRMDIARQAAHRYGREVSWGARIGDTGQLFTTVAAPVMTRLRQPERQVLDTLVDAGVARSRADALAWAVRLVGQNADVWLADLRAAMEEVARLRTLGPDLG